MNDTLFQFEEEQAKNDGPVSCLGITFNSDSERREYYRNELRKKLPELKLIEGFPIGEDEDIIALSDPPYYTACPNPWINDFIKEWEDEKVQLQKEGKRSADFEVKEPYAADVSEGKNNPIYMAHAYHTKVPHPAIMRYILHYTQPGDIVFDGFCGTGMTGVAAKLCGNAQEVKCLNEPNSIIGERKSLCSDLSPIASLISASYNLKFNAKLFKASAEKILKQVEDELGWLFEFSLNGQTAKITSTIWSDVITCHNCGHEMTLWDESVDFQNESISDNFKCPVCGALCSKKNTTKTKHTIFDPFIGSSIEQSLKIPVRYYYNINGHRGSIPAKQITIDVESGLKFVDKESIPCTRMPEGDEARRNDKDGITNVHHFYTQRSLLYLSRVYELCKSNTHLLAWFTSSLLSTSVMNKFRFSGTGINSGTLYIPSINWEFTPLYTLQRKIQSFTQCDIVKTAPSSLISVMSATSLSLVPNGIADYMFIDPPFGANLMYSELNFIWEDWIKIKTQNKDEAIVNKTQCKSIFEYQTLMNMSLKEFYRILKPGKWLTMEFSNTSASVWNSIQNALQGVGFVVANVAALDKQQGSFKAVNSPTAVKQDLIITCFKPTAELTAKFDASSNTASNAWDFIEELLEHLPVHLKKDNSTTAVIERSPKILFDRLIAYYVQKGYPVPMDAAEFQKGLKDRFVERDGMFFTAEQAIEYEDKKKDTTSFIALFILVGSEAEGIEWLKRKLEDGPKTYSEILPDWMQDLVKPKKGDSLPELMQILEENFLKDEEGHWYIPDSNKQTDLDAIRTKKLLKEFEVYIEAKKIKDARLEALRAGFKECYKNKDFATIVAVGDKLPEELLTTDEILLQYYDIASLRV